MIMKVNVLGREVIKCNRGAHLKVDSLLQSTCPDVEFEVSIGLEIL